MMRLCNVKGWIPQLTHQLCLSVVLFATATSQLNQVMLLPRLVLCFILFCLNYLFLSIPFQPPGLPPDPASQLSLPATRPSYHISSDNSCIITCIQRKCSFLKLFSMHVMLVLDLSSLYLGRIYTSHKPLRSPARTSMIQRLTTPVLVSFKFVFVFPDKQV